MPVAFDAKGTDSFVNGALTLSITGPTITAVGSNVALIAQIAWSGTTFPTVVTVDWDHAGTNQTLTLVPNTSVVENSAGGVCSALYYRIAPTSGQKTLRVTWTDQNRDCTMQGVSFTGVDQTGGATSFPNGVTTAGTAANPSLSITSATGHMITSVFASFNAFSGITGTQTFQNNGSNNVNGTGNYDSGAATVTSTATAAGGSQECGSGCDIAAASASLTLTGSQQLVMMRKAFMGWRKRSGVLVPAWSMRRAA